MKLYATVTSERATKGQGGNEFINIELKDEKQNVICLIGYIEIAIGCYELSVINKKPNNLSIEIEETKGEKKKGENLKCNCEYGYSDPLCNKNHTFKI